MTRPPQHPLQGILLVVLAMACFATLDTTIKIVSLTVPALVVLWSRYLVQLAATVIAVLPARGWRSLRTAHPWMHLLRGLLMLSTSLLGFYGLRHLPIAEFIAIIMLTPLSVTVVSALLLGEHIIGLRWLLVVGGFVGALLVIQPGDSSLGWPLLYAFGCMSTNTLYQLITGRMTRTEHPLTMHLLTALIGTLIMSALVPMAWQPIVSTTTWSLLLLGGLLATIGHFLLMVALGRAQASILAPFQYTHLVFAMLAGWLVFDHIPGLLELAGMGLILVCGATSAWLSSKPVIDDAA